MTLWYLSSAISVDLTLVVFACMGVAALTGPPIGGAIQAAQGGDYIGAQAWAAGSTLICVVFFTLSRMHRAAWKLRAKV